MFPAYLKNYEPTSQLKKYNEILNYFQLNIDMGVCD